MSKETKTIQRAVSTLLAKGYPEEDIVDVLLADEELEIETEEQAWAAIQDTYEGWTMTESNCGSSSRKYMMALHVRLRKQLLKKVMDSSDVADLRFALSVLDSLANVQGLNQPGENETIDIKIEIVPESQRPKETLDGNS